MEESPKKLKSMKNIIQQQEEACGWQDEEEVVQCSQITAGYVQQATADDGMCGRPKCNND